MTKILGLDVGTNSIGWSIIDHDFEKKDGKILGLGSRIIPMSQDMISDFNKGNLQSSAAQRTAYRGVRRLRERSLNRRKRLLKTLKLLNFISTDFTVNSTQSVAYTDTKFKFLESYNEMASIIKARHNATKTITHDWTIYYLRVKALSQRITKEELAWVILQFNQKRGYYQLRDDNTLTTDSKKYFISEVVDNILVDDSMTKGQKHFVLELRNEIKGLYVAQDYPDWIGKKIDFIVTETTLKDGSIKVKLTAPDQNDWTLRKKKTESELEQSEKTPGQYIFDKLLDDPTVKIRGKEVHTIDRKYYKEELTRILEKQTEYHPELADDNLLKTIASALYKSNQSHKSNLIKQTIAHVIINDIIFYQRPLKSKKHLIANCKYESYHYVKNGELTKTPIKGIAKSHPLFQEYRIWSLIHNLKILRREHRDNNDILQYDNDCTAEYLNYKNKAEVFDLFNFKKEISQSMFLKAIGLSKTDYRWNYEEDIKLKGNETLAAIIKQIKGIDSEKSTKEILQDEQKLELIWHALYSLDKDDNVRKALSNPTLTLSLDAIDAITNVPTLAKDYGSLSYKAIAKMLPLMRCGKYWQSDRIDEQSLIRIENLVNGEFDPGIINRVRDLTSDFKELNDFQGCPEWLASYIVYNRHSEVVNTAIYNLPTDINVTRLIPQHSLRNPIVEKILRETMLVVRDIWTQYGKPDEIHVELARELKLPAKTREKYTYKRNENRRTNERAKAMLRELQKEDANINPFSVGQLELFKLYEEGTAPLITKQDDEIKAIKRKSDPSTSELKKYRLWLDQKYISPYTGQPIPLSKLFSPAYEIEHVIPKSKYYDNSFANKIICEREANTLKGSKTAYQFINEDGGTQLSNGYTILDKDQYESLVLKMFRGNRTKIKNLLSYEVPKSFISRQLNDTRYISKKLLELLDPVVRDNQDTDSRSRHLIPMVGGITHQMKRDWGLHDKWKQLLAPRFQRMNELHDTDEFYSESNNQIHLSGNDTDIKRLDHRHHALDALVIACTTRQHIQYINTYQDKKIRFDLIPKLFVQNESKPTYKTYQKPWTTIATDAYDALQKVIVSFKQNNRIINRTSNYYQKYVEINGKLSKQYVKQVKSPDFWSVRQPMHAETIRGRRTIREYKEMTLVNALKDIDAIANPTIKSTLKQRLIACNNDLKALKKDLKSNHLKIDGKTISKVKIIVINNQYSSSRIQVDQKLDKKKIITKVLGGNTKRILLNHLLKYNDDHELAFSPNGIIDLNKDLSIPIYKVTVVEELGKTFSLGEDGVNAKKFAKSAKGTNLFFTIYKHNVTGEHLITKDSTLSFGDTMRLMKENLPLAEEIEGYTPFSLTPGDLVYVFNTDEEKILPDELDYSKIYKCVSFTKQQCFFIPSSLSSPILNKQEFSALNKQEKSVDEVMIKANCTKLHIDRLGKLISKPK